jgi:hypothetical protein
MTESTRSIKLLPHQIKFLQSRKPFVALCGGLGCGKSYGIGGKSYQLASENWGMQGAIISRSSKQLYDFLMPEVETFWRRIGAQYDWQDGNKLILGPKNGTHSTVHLLTTENEAYKRWSGGNWAWACIDEIDTMPKASEVWSYVSDRVRHNDATLLQMACASTPEGYKFLYDFFEKQPNADSSIDDRELIQGCSFDNPYINENYVMRLIRTRNPLQLRAYVYGEFCNLEGSLVYYNYKPDYEDGNWTRRTLKDFSEDAVMHWGGDFNKNINPFIAHIIEGNGAYAVRTIRGLADIDDVITEIKKQYPNRKHKFYPDACSSGGITQLNKAFGEMNVITSDPLRDKKLRRNTDNGNPDVDKRITSLHELILDSGTEQRRYFVNPETCPDLDRALQYQTYNDEDEPDKDSGMDHDPDAAGYFGHRKFPYMEKVTPKIYSV